ncbi:MAG TPA: hypothetical protein PL037_09325, partial [Elusimicrobiales bacterium]|nr:hypothetical protein [Elusimicrobiales bacterium]
EPAAYFHLWKMWLAMFVSPGTLTGLALLVIVLALLAGRLLRPGELLRDGRAAGIFLTGFWAMGVEIACLFLFQNFSGQLNWKIGVLFAGFMVGSAAGALLFARMSPLRGRAAVLSLAFLLTLGLWHYVPALGELRPAMLFPPFLGVIICAGAAAGGYYAAAGGGEAPCVRLYYSELLGAA